MNTADVNRKKDEKTSDTSDNEAELHHTNYSLDDSIPPSDEGTRQRTGAVVCRSDPIATDNDQLEQDLMDNQDDFDGDNKETRLTLVEEVLLLGLKDREGHTSFWNDCISSGLRGAIIIELGLRGRIGLEPARARYRCLSDRRVNVTNPVLTGDVLLDETLNHIKCSQEKFNVKTWIGYLSGETWNPFRLGLQLRNVRERIAKNLSEKGVCTTEKQNYVLFDMTTHPLAENKVKEKILRKVQDALITRWCSSLHRMSKRALSLVYLAQVSDVIENALTPLTDDDYSLASKRLRDLSCVNLNTEASKEGSTEIMWAVFDSFNN